MREPAKKNILDEFCIDFCKIVEKHVNYIIVSGFLAISSGRARGTEDIDMIIERIDKNIFVNLHDDLVNNGFTCMQSDDSGEIYDYLKDKVSVRYTYKNQPLPEMEMKLAKDSLDDYQLKTRIKVELTGLDVWFSSIEMNIAFKEEYLKSPKDLEDARHLRTVFREAIHEEEVDKIKKWIQEKRLKG